MTRQGPRMQQIADWLEKLGMAEYAKAFAENRIDVSVLPELTDLDLEKIGVVLARRSAQNPARKPRAWGYGPIRPRACFSRAEAPRHRRTPPGHGDVLGPCRLHGARHPHGPRGLTRGHFGLPKMRRRDGRSLRRLRREVHGRRRPGLLWLSAGA
jgi:hypothetical protein